eukprot:PhF_6_TR21199/c0_g7_i1/m.30596
MSGQQHSPNPVDGTAPTVRAPDPVFASLPPDLVKALQQTIQQIFKEIDDYRHKLEDEIKQYLDDSINSRLLAIQEVLEAKFRSIPTAAPVFVGIPPADFLQPRKWSMAILARIDRTAFRTAWKQ